MEFREKFCMKKCCDAESYGRRPRFPSLLGCETVCVTDIVMHAFGLATSQLNWEDPV